MRRNKLKPKNNLDKKGFTLIELLIVVAIIGILASIAIPQFVQYRIRSFNASATSDLRNVRLTQEAMFNEWQAYGQTQGVAVGSGSLANGAGGQAVVGPSSAGNPAILTLVDSVLTQRDNQIALSNMVTMVASTDVNATSYTIISKHAQGNTAYGADPDSAVNYRDPTTWLPGTTITAGNEPAPNPGADDFSGVGGWMVM